MVNPLLILLCNCSLTVGCYIPYSVKLSREKLSRIGDKYDLCGKKLSPIGRMCRAKGATPPNFAEKTFANSHKTAKFAKVFSLESFPIYDIFHWISGKI